MKKLFALTLALALVLALGTTTFATTLTAVGNDTGTVKASVSSTSAPETISVDVAWGNLTFVYSSTAAWNPATHQEDITAGWAVTGSNFQDVVTVTNHSNVALTATASFAAETGFTGTLDKTTAQPLAAANKTDGASSVTFGLRMSGTPTADNQTLGTLTVTIAKPAA